MDRCLRSRERTRSTAAAVAVGLVVFAGARAAAGAPAPEDAPVEEVAPAEEPRDYAGDLAVESTTQDLEALQRQLEAVTTRLEVVERELEETRANPKPKPKPRAVTPAEYGLRVSGYIQAQYVWNQLSEDQLQQGGTPLNRDRFMVRRGRLRVAGDWRYFAFAFEIDGSTTRGPFVGVRQAHVSALWRNPDAARPPFVMATVGLTEAPFGYEVRLGQREMIFMERSLGSLAFFPGPVDVGVRVRGGVGPFRYDVAVMNGTPLDDRAGGPSGIDPTRKPDVIGRLGFEATPRRVVIAGGASFLTGTGFHPGTDSTKNLLQWNDINQNGTLDTGETISVPGTAALPSENFARWAFNADVQLMIRSKIGWSRVLGEATMAQNLDRGLFVADPIASGSSIRELQAYGAFLQDITKWSVLGARYDFYDHNADLLDTQRGRFVPANSMIHTVSPLVGAILPRGVVRGFQGRLVLQYDLVLDALGRDSRGVPANIRNDQITVRVQGEF